MLTPGVDIFLIKLAITLCSYATEQHCLRKFNLEVCLSSAEVRQACTSTCWIHRFLQTHWSVGLQLSNHRTLFTKVFELIPSLVRNEFNAVALIIENRMRTKYLNSSVLLTPISCLVIRRISWPQLCSVQQTNYSHYWQNACSILVICYVLYHYCRRM